MQIKGLHKNIYKLYAYARTQECLQVYHQKYDDYVNNWQKLKQEGVSDKLCQEFAGLSRASFFRAKKILNDLDQGITPPSNIITPINKTTCLRRVSPPYKGRGLKRHGKKYEEITAYGRI